MPNNALCHLPNASLAWALEASRLTAAPATCLVAPEACSDGLLPHDSTSHSHSRIQRPRYSSKTLISTFAKNLIH